MICMHTAGSGPLASSAPASLASSLSMSSSTTSPFLSCDSQLRAQEFAQALRQPQVCTLTLQLLQELLDVGCEASQSGWLRRHGVLMPCRGCLDRHGLTTAACWALPCEAVASPPSKCASTACSRLRSSLVSRFASSPSSSVSGTSSPSSLPSKSLSSADCCGFASAPPACKQHS